MSRKSKYSSSFKLSAVERVLKDNVSFTKVCDELNLGKTDLRKWIKFYKEYGLSGLTPRSFNIKYSSSFKLKVVRSIEQEGLSFGEASLKFNIPSSSTVRKWYLICEKYGIKGLKIESRGRFRTMNKKPKKKTSKKPLTREEELLLENESLKAELALLKKLQALAQARKKKQ